MIPFGNPLVLLVRLEKAWPFQKVTKKDIIYNSRGGLMNTTS